MNNKKIYKTIMLILIVALITFVLTTTFIYNKIGESNRPYNILLGNNYKLELAIAKIRQIIDEDYLGEIDEEKLIDYAIKGYVEGLGDKYTEYFTEKEMEEFITDTAGDYVGIGIYMAQDTDNDAIVIISPIEGSPADKAGLRPGDIIKKVDDVEYSAENFDDVATYIKGKEGTKVKLEIERDEERITVEVERKKVDLYPIEAKVIENNIGYINLPSFDEDCSKEFKKQYEKLEEKNITSLIIDLRNNGGGILDETLEIADYLLEKDDTIVITANKNGEEEIEKSKKEQKINLPVVLLINENSASASEILAAALKDNKRATLVGKTTYGKGLIQELITLNTGAGLKITIEEYYTPNRDKINKIGVEPHYEVELPESVESEYLVKEDEDTQLKKAIEILKNN